jgi:hypothetical protein
MNDVDLDVGMGELSNGFGKRFERSLDVGFKDEVKILELYFSNLFIEFF